MVEYFKYVSKGFSSNVFDHVTAVSSIQIKIKIYLVRICWSHQQMKMFSDKVVGRLID